MASMLSYSARLALSLSVSYASWMSLNLSSSERRTAVSAPRVLSGWNFIAQRRCAALISWALAVGPTPRMS